MEVIVDLIANKCVSRRGVFPFRFRGSCRLGHAAVAGNFGVADHWGFLCWSCLPSVAQVVLLPIGSIIVKATGSRTHLDWDTNRQFIDIQQYLLDFTARS